MEVSYRIGAACLPRQRRFLVVRDPTVYTFVSRLLQSVLDVHQVAAPREEALMELMKPLRTAKAASIGTKEEKKKATMSLDVISKAAGADYKRYRSVQHAQKELYAAHKNKSSSSSLTKTVVAPSPRRRHHLDDHFDEEEEQHPLPGPRRRRPRSPPRAEATFHGRGNASPTSLSHLKREKLQEPVTRCTGREHAPRTDSAASDVSGDAVARRYCLGSAEAEGNVQAGGS